LEVCFKFCFKLLPIVQIGKMKLFLSLLALVSTSCFAEEDKAVTSRLNYYRGAHGAGPMKWDKELEDKARKAVDAGCAKGPGHHPGTEAEQASLWDHPWDCDRVVQTGQEPEGVLLGALKLWYNECSNCSHQANDKCQSFTLYTGHFTHVVWKGQNKYGLYAKTCLDGPDKGRCKAALKTSGPVPQNLGGSFGSNVEFKGVCADGSRLPGAVGGLGANNEWKFNCNAKGTECTLSAGNPSAPVTAGNFAVAPITEVFKADGGIERKIPQQGNPWATYAALLPATYFIGSTPAIRQFPALSPYQMYPRWAMPSSYLHQLPVTAPLAFAG